MYADPNIEARHLQSAGSCNAGVALSHAGRASASIRWATLFSMAKALRRIGQPTFPLPCLDRLNSRSTLPADELPGILHRWSTCELGTAVASLATTNESLDWCQNALAVDARRQQMPWPRVEISSRCTERSRIVARLLCKKSAEGTRPCCRTNISKTYVIGIF